MADFPGILDHAKSGKPDTETVSLDSASVGQITGSVLSRDGEGSCSKVNPTDFEDRLNQLCSTAQDAESELSGKKARIVVTTPRRRPPKGEPLMRAVIHRKEPRRKAPRKTRKEKALQNMWSAEMIEAQRLLLGPLPSSPRVPDVPIAPESSVATDDFETKGNNSPALLKESRRKQG
ncbi:MAG: hypothetical protein Q9223_005168 [Gallowayella weberi]